MYTRIIMLHLRLKLIKTPNLCHTQQMTLHDGRHSDMLQKTQIVIYYHITKRLLI